MTTPSESRPGRASPWQIGLGLAFSLFFLWLALRGVDLAETLRAMRTLNGWLLGAALFSSVFSIAARALRWQQLLTARRVPAFEKVFSALAIGLMANSFLPARLGDFARAYLLGEAEAESKAYILGSIALEKLADLFFLLLSLLILFAQMSFPAWLAAPARTTAALIFALLPLFLLLLWQKDAFLRLAAWLGRRFFPAWQQVFSRQLRQLLDGLDALRRPRLLLNFLGWSCIVWIFSILNNALVFWAMGFALPWWTAIFVLTVLQAGIVVPASPGRVGVFQYLVVLSLAVLAVKKDAALAYSIVLYLVVYLPVLLLGALCLWRERTAWKKMTAALDTLRRAGNSRP